MADELTTNLDLPPAPEVAAYEPRLVYIVEAVYEDGVIKPLVPLELPTGTPITLQITTRVTATVVPGEDSLAATRDHAPGGALPATLAPGLTRPRSQLPMLGSWLKASLPRPSLAAAFTRADVLLLAFGLLSYGVTRVIRFFPSRRHR